MRTNRTCSKVRVATSLVTSTRFEAHPVRISHPAAATRLLTNAAACPCHDRSIDLLLSSFAGFGAARTMALAGAVMVVLERVVAVLIALVTRAAAGEEAGPVVVDTRLVEEARRSRWLPCAGAVLAIASLPLRVSERFDDKDGGSASALGCTVASCKAVGCRARFFCWSIHTYSTGEVKRWNKWNELWNP